MIDIASDKVERCGVVLKDGSWLEISNVHPEPEKGFHMDPTSFVAALEAGAVATWHTHPGKDPNLSEEDMIGFRQWPQLKHYIVGIRDGVQTVAAFEIKDGVVVNLS